MKTLLQSLLACLSACLPLAVFSLDQELPLTISERTAVYADHYSDSSKIMFYASKNEKVKAISHYGNYQVRFEDGTIGWVNPLALAENLRMLVTDSLEAYSKPDFSSPSPLRFRKGDTLSMLKYGNKGQMVLVRSRTGEGWIATRRFVPLNNSTVPEYQVQLAIYSYSGFHNRARQTAYPDLERRFGPPTSLQRLNGENLAFYTDITVVKNDRHYKGVWLIFRGDTFVRDSLFGKGEKAWFEYLPLANVMRGLNVGRGFNIRNSGVVRSLESWGKQKRIFRVFVEGLKWIVLGAFFLLPVFLRKYFYSWILRVKVLSNRMVRILNYIVFYLLFYLVYLFFISQFFYPIATLYTIVMVAGLVYVLRKKEIKKFNHHVVDARRCSNCGSMDQLWKLKSVELSKEHKVHIDTWKKSLGSDTQTKWIADTSVTVKTNYYEQKSNAYEYTVLHMVDYLSCAKCHHDQEFHWTTTESGHV